MIPTPRGDAAPGDAQHPRDRSAHDVHVRAFPDCDAAATAAAEVFVAALGGGTPEAPRRVLLAGGSTPERLYRLLAEERVVPRALWRGVECFFGDERCVPADHPDSNFGMVRRCLLERLGDSAPATHRILAEDPSAESAAMAYEALLRARFEIGLRETPAFDLALLGVGPDGHTASLFPGADPGPDSQRLVSPARRPQDGSQRITVTYRVLNAAMRVLFFVCGTEKQDAVARSLAPSPGKAPTPAALVRPESGEVVWILDEAAAGKAIPLEKSS